MARSKEWTREKTQAFIAEEQGISPEQLTCVSEDFKVGSLTFRDTSGLLHTAHFPTGRPEPVIVTVGGETETGPEQKP